MTSILSSPEVVAIPLLRGNLAAVD